MQPELQTVDPDQTALLGAVWSGSALFAQTYLSDHYGIGDMSWDYGTFRPQ